MKTDEQEELNRALTRMYEHVVGVEGFVPPLYVAIVAANGTMSYERMTDREDSVMLAQHDSKSDATAFPIRVVIVDANGSSTWNTLHLETRPAPAKAAGEVAS